MENSDCERRKSRRAALSLPCQISFASGSEKINSKILDLSTGGACCVLDQTLPSNIKHIQASTGENDLQFNSECTVVWRDDANKKYGLKFKENYPKTLKLIEDIQEKFDLEKININKLGRRSSNRFYLNYLAQFSCVSSEKIECKILDISKEGALISVPRFLDIFHRNLPITIFFSYKNDLNAIFKGKTTWKNQINSDCLIGIKFYNTDSNFFHMKNFLEAIQELKLVADRRSFSSNEIFPVKQRTSDNLVDYFESPYHDFFASLKKINLFNEIGTIVLSSSLSYLKNKISQLSAGKKILFVETIKQKIEGRVLLILNLDCRRKHESFCLIDFQEYALKNNGKQEPLNTLSLISSKLKEDAEIIILSLGLIENKKLASKYLQVSKLENINFIDSRTIFATKRKLFSEIFCDGKYLIQEVQGKFEIDKIQDFSERLYSQDFNFDKRIDGLFINHSDYFKVMEFETQKIITVARVTWHLPGYYLPCMLAQKKSSSDHIILTDPDNVSYGEIYAPYLNSFITWKIYGRMIKIFYLYCDKLFFDVILTTYDASKPREFLFLSKYWGFKQTGTVLQYGNFGQFWHLIFCYKSIFDKTMNHLISSNKKSKPIMDFLG